MRRLEHKTVVVTGASGGIGQALAAALAEEGAALGLVGRDAAKLQRAAASLPAGTPSRMFSADFCDNESVSVLGAALAGAFQTLDVLIHCAGMIKLAPLSAAPLQDLDAHYRCNVRAPVALTQALLPALIAARGTIVFINSSAVDHPRADTCHYAASKNALKSVADSLRDEVNRRGVRVLSVFLGRTATPMQERVILAERGVYDAAHLIQPMDVASFIVNSVASAPTVELTNLHLRPAFPPA